MQCRFFFFPLFFPDSCQRVPLSVSWLSSSPPLSRWRSEPASSTFGSLTYHRLPPLPPLDVYLLTNAQPFNEAFDIVRFRECELQHSRWAMLGLLGVIVAENSTGISWVDAGKVLNEQPSYLGYDINLPLSTLVGIEVVAMGFAEVSRSGGTYGLVNHHTLRQIIFL